MTLPAPDIEGPNQNQASIIMFVLGSVSFSGLLLGMLLLLSACVSSGPDGQAPQPSPDDGAPVRIYFGTDRTPGDNTPENQELFGNTRNLKNFSFGFCDVVLPKDHKLGQLSLPSVWRLEFGATRGKHIVIENMGLARREPFLGTLRGRMATYPRKEAFVFIHGYNVTFAEAALRAAQMAVDLKFDGIPILYSWPSEGAISGYAADEATVEWTQPHLAAFLRDVVTQTDARLVHIIAHSMGNRPTTKAFLELMNTLPVPERVKVRNLILTAPDIDTDIFREQLAPRLTTYPTRITLYVSARDDALSMSRKFHTYSRIGLLEQGKYPPVLPGIETIDVSDVDSSFLGHSYYAEKRSVVEDIFHLIRNDLPARNRYGLKEFRAPNGSYWRMLAEEK